MSKSNIKVVGKINLDLVKWWEDEEGLAPMTTTCPTCGGKLYTSECGRCIDEY